MQENKNHEPIFISHAHRDYGLAAAISDAFDAAFENEKGKGFCFVSSDDYRGLSYGSPVVSDVVDRVKKSRVVLSVLTENSTGRPWIFYEAGLAVGCGDGKLVIPITFPGCDKNSIPEFLNGSLRLDVSAWDDKADNKIKKLFKDVIVEIKLEQTRDLEKMATRFLNSFRDAHIKLNRRQQVCNICIKETVDANGFVGLEVLLVRNRKSDGTIGNRWHFPKRSLDYKDKNGNRRMLISAETAANIIAAFEGGVVSEIIRGIGSYKHWKEDEEKDGKPGEPYYVQAFLSRFIDMDNDNTDYVMKRREPTWFSLEEALDKVCIDRKVFKHRELTNILSGAFEEYKKEVDGGQGFGD